MLAPKTHGQSLLGKYSYFATTLIYCLVWSLHWYLLVPAFSILSLWKRSVKYPCRASHDVSPSRPSQTLPSAIFKKKRQDPERSSISNQQQVPDGLDSSHDSEPPPSLRSLMTPSVLIPFINYAFLAFVDQCCSVLMPLVFATSIPYGGLGLSPFAIGLIMSSLGVILGLSSALFFPPLSRRFGYRTIFRVAIAGYAIVVLTFPFMNYSARRTGAVNAATWAFIAILMACSAITTMSYSKS